VAAFGSGGKPTYAALRSNDRETLDGGTRAMNVHLDDLRAPQMFVPSNASKLEHPFEPKATIAVFRGRQDWALDPRPMISQANTACRLAP
jgi:hypothetical protein